MNKIFWGYLLTVLNFNITFGSMRLNVIPSFIGYAVMVLGFAEMGKESRSFGKAEPIAIIVTAVSAVVFALDLMGYRWYLETLWMVKLLELAVVIMDLWIVYLAAKGVIDMEERYNRDLNGGRLKKAWERYAYSMLIIIVTMICFLVIIVIVSYVALATAIWILILGVLILVELNRCRKKYYAMLEEGVYRKIK